MNLPNRLTVIRIILTPLFLLALMWQGLPHNYLIALIIFAAASLTDMADGMIARKQNLITDFGKFLDPLADKMLTTAAFLAFIGLGIGKGVVWVTFIILIREFLITSLRLISAGKGKVVAANIFGKIKTVVQMVTVIAIMFAEYLIVNLKVIKLDSHLFSFIKGAETGLLWASALIAVISGITYLKDNWEYIDPNK